MPTLDWLGRAADLRAHERVPTRLLVDEPGLAFGEPSGNLLVQGDNLEALKALLPVYGGRVRCVYIDPPYNTGSAFAHYDDNLEHATWLAMMVPRLKLLREFLREDGSIWVSIDDREGHYLKVVMDEVFGRRNFVANVVWQKTLTRRNDARVMSSAHDHILMYAANADKLATNQVASGEKRRVTYTNRDHDPRGDWLAIPFHAPNIRPNLTYEIVTPGGRRLLPPAGRCWSTTKEQYMELLADDRIYFGRDSNGMAQRKKFWSETISTMVPWTWWGYEEAGDNREANREAKALASHDEGSESFDTPKPEKLLKRILDIATDPGDLVLDSFLGSGTTAAVAHKMGRAWVGIEMGDHARSHCALRLRKVVEGEQGGVSEAVGWTGGGGFRFATLGPAVFDADGRLDPAIGFADLASHLWWGETGTALPRPPEGPVLGAHGGRHVALLHNGVLRDRAPRGGNVLTHATLRLLREAAPEGPITVYAAASRLSADTLRARGVTFRQTPFDLRGGGGPWS